MKHITHTEVLVQHRCILKTNIKENICVTFTSVKNRTVPFHGGERGPAGSSLVAQQ